MSKTYVSLLDVSNVWKRPNPQVHVKPVKLSRTCNRSKWTKFCGNDKILKEGGRIRSNDKYRSILSIFGGRYPISPRIVQLQGWRFNWATNINQYQRSDIPIFVKRPLSIDFIEFCAEFIEVGDTWEWWPLDSSYSKKTFAQYLIRSLAIDLINFC